MTTFAVDRDRPSFAGHPATWLLEAARELRAADAAGSR